MIVSDSTTLIVLLDLQCMELLSNLFTEIIIPEAVYGEITVKNNNSLPSWMKVKKVKDSETLDTLKLLLDEGESEAIALALSLEMSLIIDEKKGRKIALNKGIKIVGLLGIVYLNVKKGYMTKDEARDFMQDALAHGYRISPALIEQMFERL